MAKRKVRPTARGYIRKNREEICALIKECHTDFICFCAPGEQEKWLRAVKSDKGDAMEILLDFKALLLDLYRCHKDRSRGCTEYNCGLLKRMRFRMRSLDVSFIRFRQ